MPIGLGLLVLQYAAELISLRDRARAAVRHSEKADAEEIAREQAREALGGAG